MTDKPLTCQRILHPHRAETLDEVERNGSGLSETNHGTSRPGENPGDRCLSRPEIEELSKNPSKTECPRDIMEFLSRPKQLTHPELLHAKKQHPSLELYSLEIVTFDGDPPSTARYKTIVTMLENIRQMKIDYILQTEKDTYYLLQKSTEHEKAKPGVQRKTSGDSSNVSES